MKNTSRLVINYLIILLGAALSGFSVSCFLAPNNVISGGVSGAAILIGNFLPITVGLISLLINVPIFIWGVLKLGKSLGLATVVGTVSLSAFIDLFALLGPLTDDLVLASLFGGVIGGAGAGLVFYVGATTGGVDIIAKIIKLKRRHLKLGRIILMIDLVIILFAVIVFKNIDIGLYSVISFYMTSFVTDLILEGFNFAKLVFVISDFSSEISVKINKKLYRGVTFLHGNGAYTGKYKNVIMCTIRNSEIPLFKDIVKSEDESAFVLITDAREVLGEGFARY